MITVDTLQKAARTNNHAEIHINVCEAHKWIFVVNLQSASTSLRDLLLRSELERIGDTSQKIRPKKEMRKAFEGIDTIGAEALVERLNSPDYFKFTCVRHPYTRTISAFYKKSDKPEMKLRMEQLFKSYEIPFSWPMEFSSFLSFLEQYSAEPETLNRHWISQASGTFASVIAYDKLLRFETLSEDLASIADRLCIDVSALRHLNKRSEGVKYDRLLTQSNKDRIWALYREDFEMFNYKR